jgi:hypothetical protein
MIEAAERKGKMKPEIAAEWTARIREIEESMYFTFWDFRKFGANTQSAKASTTQSA